MAPTDSSAQDRSNEAASIALTAHELNLLTVSAQHKPILQQKICPTSKAYRFYIDMASLTAFAPQALGNIDQLEHKHDCQIHNANDAVNFANQELQSHIDPYTKVLGTDATLAVNERISGSHASLITPDIEDANLPGGLAYIRINDFLNQHAPDQLAAALKKHSGAKGYILDVRDNPGGVIQNAERLASSFLGFNKVVSTKERADSDAAQPKYNTESVYVTLWQTIRIDQKPGQVIPIVRTSDRMPNLVGNKPIVVLADGGTASAAELFTGALQDNHRATVIGTRTFGKGVGQYNFPLPETRRHAGANDIPLNASMHVTALRYFTPSGTWLGDGYKNRIGINPDIVVQEARDAVEGPGSATDSQLKAAEQYLNHRINS